MIRDAEPILTHALADYIGRHRRDLLTCPPDVEARMVERAWKLKGVYESPRHAEATS